MKNFSGKALFLDRADINTDEIIAAKYLTEISKEALGPHLFEDIKLDGFDAGRDIAGKNVIISRANFGCGSSREHAPWALEDYGFRTIIAPSFADIFFNNCFKNGMLPIVLDEAIVDELFRDVAQNEGYTLTIDLEKQQIIRPNGEGIAFEVDAFRKHCLLNGLDDIGLTLQHADDIRAYEAARKQREPWVFG